MIKKAHIEAIVALTGQFNQHVLASRMAHGVGEVVPNAAVKIYELYNSANDVEFNAANIDGAMIRNALEPEDPGRWLADEESFARCVTTKEVVTIQNPDSDTIRIIFPIPGLRDVTGVAVVECEDRDADSLFLIESLICTYGNQNFLLNRNERDGLTGLLNRQAFDDHLLKIIRQMVRRRRDRDQGARVYLALLDIDLFKQVNDEFGHLLGDEVLLHFSQIMTRTFRYYDQLFRYGGEEFAILLHDVDLEIAVRVLERFRTAVENHHFPQVGKKTISIGVVQVEAGNMPSVIIDKADKALYYAKENGRNQVWSYERLEAEGRLIPQRPAAGDVDLS